MRDPLYGTHVPMLNLLISEVGVRRALEFGMGFWSTTLFCMRGIDLTCMENSEAFAQLVERECSPSRVIVYDLGPGVQPGTPYSRIDQDVWKRTTDFYTAMSRELGQFDLIFVDHYLALRRATILNFYRQCRMLVFHDSTDAQYDYEHAIRECQLGERPRFRISGRGPATDVIFTIDEPEVDVIASRLLANADGHIAKFIEVAGWPDSTAMKLERIQ